MFTSNVVLRVAVIGFLTVNHGLEELSRDIAPMDTMRHVVNQIFSSLKLKTHKYPKMREYLTIHKYFVSVSSLEIQSWKEVTKLIRLDTKIDNSSTEFTTVINEVLNEQNTNEEFNETLNDEIVNSYIENFLYTLADLKETFLSNNTYDSINSDILRHFNISDSSYGNDTHNELDSSENNADENEFWVLTETRRIYRGKVTKIKYFPFLASVQLFNQFSCAGSIIKSDLVITAASCLQLAHNNRFYRENPAFLSVRIGSSFYNGGGEVIAVIEVYFYPTYTPKTLRDNLAIMRLHRAIKFKKRHVKKIATDDDDYALPINTNGITIVGWGAKTTSNKVKNPWTNKISMDVLDIYPLEDCQDVYSKKYVTKKHFCAGFISKGGGACNRDVGAPGLVRGILMGVVSFGSPSCGTADAPTVFTKLGYYAKWIDEIKEQETVHRNARTTTRLPYTQTISTVTSDDLNFKLEPISKKSVKSYQELDFLRSDHKKVFKEFLETVFNSKELELYKDKFTGFLESKKYKEEEVNTDTEKIDLARAGDVAKVTSEEIMDPIKSVTNMDKFDPDEVSSDTEVEAATKISQESKRDTHAVVETTTDDKHILREEEAEEGLSIEAVIQSDKDEVTSDSLLTEKTRNLNITGEELDKQIDELIQNLDVGKVISSELVDNLSDRKVIDDTKLLELIDGGAKDDLTDETVLTFLYLSEGESKIGGTKLKEGDDGNENEGLSIDTDVVKDSGRSNVTVERYDGMSKGEMYDILADAINS